MRDTVVNEMTHQKGLKSKELKANTEKNRSLYIRNVTMNDFSYSMNESLGMDIPLYA